MFPRPTDTPDRLFEIFPSLCGLEPDLHAALLQKLIWQEAPADSVVFDPGEPCQAFPLLLDGEIQVMRTTPDGHEIELYRVRPGESCIVSTSCLLGDVPYSARGQTTSAVRLAALPHAVFDRLLAAHPPFRRYVFGLFGERLGLMMTRVEEVAFHSLTRRIAALMLATPDGVLVLTHERLASQIGASREAVSRALKKLEDAGALTLGRGRLSVADRGRLAAIA